MPEYQHQQPSPVAVNQEPEEMPAILRHTLRARRDTILLGADSNVADSPNDRRCAGSERLASCPRHEAIFDAACHPLETESETLTWFSANYSRDLTRNIRESNTLFLSVMPFDSLQFSRGEILHVVVTHHVGNKRNTEPRFTIKDRKRMALVALKHNFRSHCRSFCIDISFTGAQNLDVQNVSRGTLNSRGGPARPSIRLQK